MYVKHSLIYLLAKLAPALASFVVLAAYTRWMSAEEYGIFTTILVVASSVSLFAFGWLYVGIMRFWDKQELSAGAVERLISVSVLVIALVVGVLAALFAWLTGQVAVATGFFLVFLSSAFYEAYQRINSITLKVNHYLWAEVGRTVLTMGSGLLLVWLGYAWLGAIGGVVLGVLLVLVLSGALWRHFRPAWRELDGSVLRALLVYGLPLSLSFVLLEIIHASDRVMVGWLLGYAQAGEYAVAYNLPFQILMMLTSSLNLAAYPLVIRTLEQAGREQAEARLQQYFVLLMGVSIPAILGLLGIAEAFIPLLVGAEFVPSSLRLLPWIGLAILANCTYLFYVSLAFQLAEYTAGAVKVVGVAAVVNVLLNLVLIPEYGLLGAVLASLAAYLICVVYGYYLGRQYFALNIPVLDIGKILLAAVGMYALMEQIPVLAVHNAYVVVLKILLGMASYAVLVWLLDIGQVRQLIKARFTWATRCSTSSLP
ncbi:oligosaccharide flippase family protein [Thiothrix subterranea]|uniref:Oligosaccharide flippase family protein n=1 Tax=Thiothrix subterranea TaxID=2735563 RepID=A0AA51R410_9GAMM|nr:oligosaccharide flippase family protein [Thiothrix subterranea]MDQ5768902.1 oligosaccharide flippase family protein [Thiothrix subterranea]WML86181.1 oligosaccharide flippase family protein [Thiothrix subterranea]